MKLKEELKRSEHLKIGDKIRIGGLLCEVVKVDDVFHYMPNSRVRLTLTIADSTSKSKKNELILALPGDLSVTTLK